MIVFTRLLIAVIAVVLTGSTIEGQSEKSTDKTRQISMPEKTWPKYVNIVLRNNKGTFFQDPVCSKFGAIGDSTPTVVIAGKNYGFESNTCRDIFRSESPKYLAGWALPTRVFSVEGQKVTLIDPVSNSKFVLGEHSPFRDYMSKRYYFSSDSTYKEFAKNPRLYSVNARMMKTRP